MIICYLTNESVSVIAFDVLEGFRIGHFRIEESNAILGKTLITRLFGDPIRKRSSVSRGIVTQTVKQSITMTNLQSKF